MSGFNTDSEHPATRAVQDRLARITLALREAHIPNDRTSALALLTLGTSSALRKGVEADDVRAVLEAYLRNGAKLTPDE